MLRAASGLTTRLQREVLSSGCASTIGDWFAARVFARQVASGAGSGAASDAAAGATHSAKQAKLFQKVLDGDFKPPEETIKPTSSTKAPSAASRSLSILGNAIFYGGLLGGAGFVASTYIVSDEDVQKARLAADTDRSTGLFAEARALLIGCFAEARAYYAEKVKGFTEPGTDALLPDLLPFQRQMRMRTLVLDLDGVLVQSVWQRKHGWKTVKRPGVEPFLETMAQYFELVVFTNRSHSYADPILNRIDPGIQNNQGPVLMYRLYKNSTQWQNNENMRDLSKLNRDLTNVVFVVSSSKAATVDPSENCLVIPDYAPSATGSNAPQDTTLLDLVPLLELIWKQDVPDTRAVCRSYHGVDVVEEFRRRDKAKVAARAAAAKPTPLRRFGFA